MSCAHCGYDKHFGGGELATCACCQRFVSVDRDPIDQVFDHLRAGMTPAQREAEHELRQRLKGQAIRAAQLPLVEEDTP